MVKLKKFLVHKKCFQVKCCLIPLVLLVIFSMSSHLAKDFSLMFFGVNCREYNELDSTQCSLRDGMRLVEQLHKTVDKQDEKHKNTVNKSEMLAWEKRINSMIVKSFVDGRNTTVEERSKFQQKQVEKFCTKYNVTNTFQLPALRDNRVLYSHLLVNSAAETLYCYVPKVGCTTLKVLFFISQGLLPPSVSDSSVYKNIGSNMIRGKVVSKSLRKIESPNTFNKVVGQYYKFIMYRHPLERLVSAYRDKVKTFHPDWDWLRKKVYQHVHPKMYESWLQKKHSQEEDISFPNFISYWLENNDSKTQNNNHFVSIFDMCAPCSVRYHYYGNFETFEQDAKVLVERIGSTMDNLRQGYHTNSTRTSLITRDMYQEISEDQRLQVLKRLWVDIDFYYHLFPSESGSHKRILSIVDDI